jgi:hypothetical protein
MGKKTLSLAALSSIALLLAACGPPMAWQKPGVSMVEAQADSRECNLLARNQAFRESFVAGYGYPGYGYPYYPYGPYGYRRSYYNDPFMYRGQRESDLQDFCLRARGYSLQPVPQ